MDSRTIRQFQDISALLNSSLEPETIRVHAIQAATLLINAEAGSLLLLDDLTGELYFDVAHGDKGPVVRHSRLRLDQGLAGYVARTGEPLIVNDVQRDGRFFCRVDEVSGYVTRSMVCVPVTAHGRPLGVLQVINKKGGEPFSQDDLEHLIALGHQVGIAIENARLYEDIHRLFEGFISASVQAIESRDPVTSGHSQRVATLTCGLAEAVSQTDSGIYADVRFSCDELRELGYAAVLHDFGKVGVREEVLLKGRKLHRHQQEILKYRFQLIKRTLELDALRQRCELYQRKKVPDRRLALARLDRALSRRMQEIDKIFAFVMQCNEPNVRSHRQLRRLLDIARREYTSYDGPQPFLTAEETHALSVVHGTLTPEERKEIERHVTHTYVILSKIPWSKTLKNVPNIARAHHEKLDGSGYPRGLMKDEIPLQARMMAICDIYDALTAWDRPYKAAIPPEKAVSYLRAEAQEGKLDPVLVDIFATAQIYRAVPRHAAVRNVV